MITDPSAPMQDSLRRASALLQAGRHADAAAALRRAMDGAPGDPAVASALAQLATLARTWLTTGQVDPSLALLAPIAGSGHANGTLLMLYAHALLAAGRQDEAEAVLRRWVQKERGNRDAALRLAAVLADTGRLTQAEVPVRNVVARHGGMLQKSAYE
ncbi:MAG: tetratricopeptide repeat protein [Rhodanobacteraceae bacterium]